MRGVGQENKLKGKEPKIGKSTGISWTDHTFNPWWGCTKVSAGCDHCYAETFDKRVGSVLICLCTLLLFGLTGAAIIFVGGITRHPPAAQLPAVFVFNPSIGHTKRLADNAPESILKVVVPLDVYDLVSSQNVSRQQWRPIGDSETFARFLIGANLPLLNRFLLDPPDQTTFREGFYAYDKFGYQISGNNLPFVIEAYENSTTCFHASRKQNSGILCDRQLALNNSIFLGGIGLSLSGLREGMSVFSALVDLPESPSVNQSQNDGENGDHNRRVRRFISGLIEGGFIFVLGFMFMSHTLNIADNISQSRYRFWLFLLLSVLSVSVGIFLIFHNLFLFTTTENQENYDLRAPAVRSIAKRMDLRWFCSYEPALGPLSIVAEGGPTPDWIIFGGESGPGRRPMERKWADDLLDECRHTATSFFMKQFSAATPDAGKALIPAELLIREFPRSSAAE